MNQLDRKNYDPHNIFAQILRGEIPCKKVYENDHVLAFLDRFPQAPLHVLTIPKGPYVSALDFNTHAPSDLLVGFGRGIAHVMQQLGMEEDQGGRLITNIGAWGGQEVPHYHVHILGGEPLGPMLVSQKRST